MFEKGKEFVKRNANVIHVAGIGIGVALITYAIGEMRGYDWGYRWGFNVRPLVDEFAKREDHEVAKEEFVEAMNKLKETLKR